MDAGLHRADGHTDDLGRDVEREPRVVVQDEGGALLRRQPLECALQGVAVVDRDDRVRDHRTVVRDRHDPADPAAALTSLLVTGIHEESMQPDLETLGVSQPREFAPGKKECLLHGVLCSIGIAKDPICDAKASAAVEVDERLEGEFIASSCPFDHPYRHGAPLRGASRRRYSKPDDGERPFVRSLFAPLIARGSAGCHFGRRGGDTVVEMSRAWRVALGLAMWFGLTGCADAERLLRPDRCTLDVMTDTKDGRVPIDPPYTVELTPPGISPPTGIGFTGTGWTTVDITQISPEGVVVDTFRGHGVDDRDVIFPLDRPGRWSFQLVDLQVGCRRTIDVTVAAPT